MPEYADIYVLTTRREPAVVELFLNTMMPEREEVIEGGYEVPASSDSPRTVLPDVPAVIRYCCENPREPYAVYLRSTGMRKPEHALIDFLSDGGLVLGVSTDSRDQELADEFCGMLLTLPGADCGYITHEDLAPDSCAGFRKFVASLPLPGRDIPIATARAESRARLMINPQMP